MRSWPAPPAPVGVLALALTSLLFACADHGDSGWPDGRDALERRGRDVFLAEGCAGCHDGRADAPVDAFDLRSVGGPRSAGWHAMHLYAPDLARAGSTMPASPGLFASSVWDPAYPDEDEPPRLSDEGRALVAYLLRLQELPARRAAVTSGLTPLSTVSTGADDLYRIFCSGCHGTEGDGDGPGAVFLADESQPRAFRPARYRVRSTPHLPTDDDLLGVLSRGLPGTAMPDFAHLPEPARASLVSFVQGYARTWQDGVSKDPFATEAREPVEVGEPPPRTAALLARGEQLLAAWGCGACHGDDLRGRRAADLGLTWPDEAGRPIPWATDLVAGRFKGGEAARDLALRLTVGMGGAPMPSYVEAASAPDDVWALVQALLARREAADLR